jgi:hypothetical protein
MAELTPVPVSSAGHLAPRLTALRWLLLACTLIGLAAMHTLGHTGHGHTMAMPEPPATHQLQNKARMLVGHVATPDERACRGGCAHLGDSDPAGGHPDGWSVCLAILAGFAIAMLLGWLLRAATTRGATYRPTRPLAVTPRAPPRPRVGLLLADLSVLRI